MTKDDISPQEAFDIISSEIQDRMSEYIVAIQAYPAVDPGSRVDIWNAIVNKRDELDQLHRQLADIEKLLRERPPQNVTAAAALLYDACRVVGWEAPQQNDERIIARWCQEQAATIKNPVARQSALEWIRRAVGYAQTERKGPTVTCIKNAKQLLGR